MCAQSKNVARETLASIKKSVSGIASHFSVKSAKAARDQKKAEDKQRLAIAEVASSAAQAIAVELVHRLKSPGGAASGAELSVWSLEFKNQDAMRCVVNACFEHGALDWFSPWVSSGAIDKLFAQLGLPKLNKRMRWTAVNAKDIEGYGSDRKCQYPLHLNNGLGEWDLVFKAAQFPQADISFVSESWDVASWPFCCAAGMCLVSTQPNHSATLRYFHCCTIATALINTNQVIHFLRKTGKPVRPSHPMTLPIGSTIWMPTVLRR